MHKRIGIIEEQLNRVVRIIQDLLSSTRQRRPEPTWYPAERLIEPVMALMEPGYHAKGVVLHSKVSPSLLVWADPGEDPSSVGQSPHQCVGRDRDRRAGDGDCSHTAASGMNASAPHAQADPISRPW